MDTFAERPHPAAVTWVSHEGSMCSNYELGPSPRLETLAGWDLACTDNCQPHVLYNSLARCAMIPIVQSLIV